MKEPSELALFRFSIISQLKGFECQGFTLAQAVAKVFALDHFAIDNRSKSISKRSIYRWYKLWKKEGINGLEPQRKKAIRFSHSLDDDLIFDLKAEKLADPEASIPELIRRAHTDGVAKGKICRTTVYRLFKRMGLPIQRQKKLRLRDARRFSKAHRMQMVMADGKHFRVGATGLKRVLISFIDDATRKILMAVVGTSENTELFLRGLFGMIEKYGLMSTIYLDKGSAFTSNETKAVIAQLGKALIFGETRYPSAHGKIERYHRTLIADCLRSIEKNPNIDPDPVALEFRINHYLENIYNKQPHTSLEGDCPDDRFMNDTAPLKMPKNYSQLHSAFTIFKSRHVSNDNIIQLSGQCFEIPRGYAGTKIIVQNQLILEKIVFLHEGKLIRLHPVDQIANASAKRAKIAETVSSEIAPNTNADRLFNRDFASAIDSDGNMKERNK